MENRFGLKDFILVGLVLAVLVVLVLSMLQFDRQWDVVKNLESQNRRMEGDLSRMNQKLEQVAAGGGGGGQIVQNFYGVGPSPQGQGTPQTFVPQTNGGSQQGMAQAGGNSAGSAGGSTSVAAAAGAEAFELMRRAEAEPEFARGGWYLDNFGTKIGGITPLISQDVYSTWIEGLVLEGLAQRNPFTKEFEPKLAERWDISEDGLTMTFYLRPGVRFSDGSPLTAEDVKFTFDWIMNPEVQAERQRSYLEQWLESVEVVDSRTVRFHFKAPYFLNFETAAGTGIMPKAFYSQYKPQDYNEEIGLLMGSGAYMLENPTTWTPAQDVVLVRNPRYWGVPATFDRMVFKQIQEEAAQLAMLRNGQLDRYAPSPELYDKLKADPEVMQMANALNYDSAYGGYTYIGWNQERRVNGVAQKTKFADPRVRRAMTMLIDRQRLVDELYRNYANVATGPFVPGNPQADPSIEPWPYDPDAAMELLAEAGWQDRNNDGVLEDESGQLFQFKLMYPGGNDITEKIVLAIQGNLEAGGIMVETERTDWPVLVKRLTESNFEAATLGWSSGIESDLYQIFHSDQAKVGGDNRTGYRSARLDEAIDAARTTMDKDQRMAHWNEAHRILHEEQPYTFLLNRQALRVMNKRINNVEKSAVGLNYEFLNGGVVPWFIPSSQQQMTR
ncbi:MAG: peptide-binding protein [Phycisphaerae bacterium]